MSIESNYIPDTCLPNLDSFEFPNSVVKLGVVQENNVLSNFEPEPVNDHGTHTKHIESSSPPSSLLITSCDEVVHQLLSFSDSLSDSETPSNSGDQEQNAINQSLSDIYSVKTIHVANTSSSESETEPMLESDSVKVVLETPVESGSSSDSSDSSNSSNSPDSSPSSISHNSPTASNSDALPQLLSDSDPSDFWEWEDFMLRCDENRIQRNQQQDLININPNFSGSYDDLPTEIWNHILQYLNLQQLLIARSLSKTISRSVMCVLKDPHNKHLIETFEDLSFQTYHLFDVLLEDELCWTKMKTKIGKFAFKLKVMKSVQRSSMGKCESPYMRFFRTRCISFWMFRELFPGQTEDVTIGLWRDYKTVSWSEVSDVERSVLKYECKFDKCIRALYIKIYGTSVPLGFNKKKLQQIGMIIKEEENKCAEDENYHNRRFPPAETSVGSRRIIVIG